MTTSLKYRYLKFQFTESHLLVRYKAAEPRTPEIVLQSMLVAHAIV
jgi:hypothetical protein